MEKIMNAKIKYSFLGIENNELFIEIGFECKSGTISTGKFRPFSWENFIEDLLNTLELQRWEDLPRKYARIRVVDDRILFIGNLIEDRWVTI
jgi:hypothetical protein